MKQRGSATSFINLWSLLLLIKGVIMDIYISNKFPTGKT